MRLEKPQCRKSVRMYAILTSGSCLSHPAFAPCPSSSLVYFKSSKPPSQEKVEAQSPISLNSALFSTNSVDRALKSPGLLGGGGSSGDRQVPTGPRVPGRAQMEWLWAGGKGQMQPSLEPQLPCYLFIVSLSPQSTTPSPAALLSSPRAPPSPSQQPSPRTPEGAPERVPRLPCSGVGGGEQKGGGRGVSGREGAWLERPRMGVSKSINHAPLRSCLTHTSLTSCQ